MVRSGVIFLISSCRPLRGIVAAMRSTSLFVMAASSYRDLGSAVDAFNAFAPLKKKSPAYNAGPPPPPSRVETESWLDVLKYDGPPKFDVLARTIEYAKLDLYSDMSYHAEDYVFRGPIVGPITAEDVRNTQESFKINSAYPGYQRRPFSFTIDPDNPYRCYFFERWEGTNTGSVQVGPIEIPPTNADVKLLTHIISIHWNPEGKIQYACLSSPLDRFEGTSKGAGAVFGLLVGAGVDTGNASVGDFKLRMQQRLVHAIGGLGRTWSVEADIPGWWKSKARGADPNDL